MSLIKGSGLTFGLKIFGMILSYVLLWVMARYMGAGSVGEFTLMITISNIVVIFSRLGFHNSLIKFIAQATVKGKYIYSNLLFLKSTWIVVVVNVFLSLALFFTAGIICDSIFHKPFLKPVIQWSVLALLPMSFSHIAAAYLRGYKRVWEFSMLQDFGNYFFCVLIFVPLFFVWPSSLLPVISWDISWFIVMLIAIWLIARIPHTQIMKFRGAGLIAAGPLLKVSLPMMLTNSLVFLLNWTDTFLIGIYKTTADVGIYASASKMATFSSLMLTANSVIVGPKLVSLYTQGKMNKLKKLLTQSSFLVSIFSLPIAFVMIAFPSPILGLFGKEFEQGRWVLIILSISQIVNSTTGLVGLALNMTGKEILMQNLMIVTTVMNVVLCLVLIPIYSIEGAAMATCISLIFKNVVSFFYVKKHLGFYSVSLDFLLERFKSKN